MMLQMNRFGFRSTRAIIDVGGHGGVVAGVGRAGATVPLVLAALLASACSSPLPDAESREARLYAQECGTCHVAYPPHMLKPAMWEMQMGRMALLRRQRGLPPISAADERAILGYLTEHAG